MDKLKVKLDHCYGIDHLEYEFDFSHGNVFAVYARNGLMKTSFAKTFKKIQQNKVEELRDEIFEISGTAEVASDENPVDPNDIFVVSSFESAYQADITPLLVDEEIKTRLKDVLKARDKLFKALEKRSELKIKRTSGGKTVFELEPALIRDFSFDENSFLVNVLSLRNRDPEADFSNIQYQRIFDDGVVKKILSPEFQSKIRDYIAKSEEIYSAYTFLSKGNLTLPKLKDVQKTLKKDSYFSQGNQIALAGVGAMEDLNALSAKIGEIDEQLKNVPEFQAIENLLSDAKGTLLRDSIETSPDIINWLTADKLPHLRVCLWLSYLKADRTLMEDLCTKYDDLSREIESVNIDNTAWKQALDIFNKRFSVPYKMEITNLKGAIIGESIPQIDFSFTKDGQVVKLNRDRLDALDTLSQGEKRALYLLNIIFEIEEVKQQNRSVLFVIDDIADSFDYKNKYAIVEYLYEIAQDDRFTMIILSHNFDFYRTISSRLGLARNNRLCVGTSDNGLTLIQEHYQNQPFEQWKLNPTEKNVIAMIPFVRNLVEFGRERYVASPDETNTDFNILTTLLHEKEYTHNMRFADLVKLFAEYLGVEQFDQSVDLQKFIMDSLYNICDSISPTDAALENKILLSMAIRHKAEAFMKEEIKRYTGQLSWRRNRRTNESGTANQFLQSIEAKGNQTRELLNGYKQIGNDSTILVLDEVAIMTPENIHLNSFMYEPIMDMDIVELITLYDKVKSLGGNQNG